MRIFGTHDQNTIDQLKTVAARAAYTALMADGHLGYGMPVGGVAAYRDEVSVMGVGFDIACGNAAIKTDATLADFGKTDVMRMLNVNRIADDIAKSIAFGIGRVNLDKDAFTEDHPLFKEDTWLRLRERAGHGNARQLKDKAVSQLGTVGSGNHYVDVFADEEDAIWVGVHFGSRGLGHTLASNFGALAVGKLWNDRVPEEECILSLRSSLGQDYWALMELAGRYAYAGREWVARKVVSILGAKELDLVHNHHNFAWKEKHFGEELVVVRKGATPAFPGQRGFVGGSMGDNSVILRGAQPGHLRGDLADETAQAESMFSTVHGAGRVMSRTSAAGKFSRKKAYLCGDYRNCDGRVPLSEKTGEENPHCPKCGYKMFKRETRDLIRPGLISQEMMQAWLEPMNVVLRGGGLDEAPQAYRRLPEVLAAQGDTVVVEHVLRPLIVVMAGADEFDPYKD